MIGKTKLANVELLSCLLEAQAGDETISQHSSKRLVTVLLKPRDVPLDVARSVPSLPARGRSALGLLQSPGWRGRKETCSVDPLLLSFGFIYVRFPIKSHLVEVPAFLLAFPSRRVIADRVLSIRR